MPNKILVDFMKEKAKLLKYPDYFREKDEADIMSWPESKCIFLIRNIIKTDIASDRSTCPFCLMHDKCEECGYGKRHKECGNNYSTYRKIIIGGSSIIDIIGEKKIKELIEKLRKKSIVLYDY